MKIPTKTTQFSVITFKRMRRWMLLAALLAGLQSTAQAATNKILFVTTGAQRDSVKLLNILKAQGHDVTNHNTIVSGNTVNATNYANAGYQLVVIDEVVGSGAIAANFKNSPIPVVTWEAFIYGNNRSAFNLITGAPNGTTYTDAASAAAANGGAGSDGGQINQLTTINIVNPSHPLAAGLAAGVTNVFDPTWVSPDVTEGNGVITFAGTRTFITNGVHVVATVPGFANGMCIFGVEAGVTNANGTTNLARWVHLPWNNTDQGERVMIEPSFFLYEAAIAWALGKPQPTKIYNLLPASGGLLSTNTTISFSVDKVTAAGSAVTTNNIQLKLNGVNVISNATIVNAGSQWNVTYTNKLQVNTTYTIIASATAADGGFGARSTIIDTFDQNNFSFEAEDFNFAGGSFFDTVVLCQTIGGGTSGCYFDRVGMTNIDKLDINFAVTTPIPTNVEVYRFGPGANREEFVDTFLSADPTVRQKYIDAGIPDYEVRNVVANEWVNYTRTYPTGTFNVYARVSSAAAMTIQMDLVGGDPTTTNQTPLTKLGRFVKPTGTTGYEMVTLTDDAGTTPLVVQFTNSVPRTIRVTALSAGFIPNFYMLVPTAAAVNLAPTITSLGSPTAGSTLTEGVSTNITATASDDGTITNMQFYAGTSEPLTLIGQDNTSPYSFTWTPPSLGALKHYIVRVVAQDNGGLTAQSNVTVKVKSPSLRIVTTAEGNGADSELRENDGTDTANGTGESMNVRITIATGTTNRHEVIGLRFDLSTNSMAAISSAALNLVSHRALSATTIHVYGVTNGTTGLDNGTNGTPGYTDNNWHETNSTFSTTPGLVWDGQEETRGLTNVFDLGATNIALNQLEVWSFSSPQLLSFLQTHPDSVVTLLIEQDTDGTGQSRFSTKEALTLQDAALPAPAGTTNWYAPFLSFTLNAAPPTLNAVRTNNNIHFSWTGTFKLQSQTNLLSVGLRTNWLDYPGGTASPVNVTISPANPTVFFRLVSP